MSGKKMLAALARDIPPRPRGSGYPEPFAARVAGRQKRKLGDAFGLTNIGINLTRLQPGAETALLHRHTVADEFIYVLAGTPTLVTDQGEMELVPGMCAGFPARGLAHHLVNRSPEPVDILEISDRLPGDGGEYPADDLKAEQDETGRWHFLHKDGTPYE
ncbi:MAG TPA: cupin domain-containing protein [Devosia sp.]|nr:cupin domain-containing protein [Devosia sp.]